MDPVNKNYLMAIRNVSGIGLQMGVAVLIGVWSGQWIDSTLNIAPYGQIFGILLGFGMAALVVYRTIKLVKNMEDNAESQ